MLQQVYVFQLSIVDPMAMMVEMYQLNHPNDKYVASMFAVLRQ